MHAMQCDRSAWPLDSPPQHRDPCAFIPIIAFNATWALLRARESQEETREFNSMVSSQVQHWLLENHRADVEDSDAELGISSAQDHPAMQHLPPQHQLVSALTAQWEGRSQAHPLLTQRHWSVASGLGERASALGALGDEYKESHRRQLRTVFNFERWRRHRSAKRYLRHMFGMRSQHRADDAGAGARAYVWVGGGVGVGGRTRHLPLPLCRPGPGGAALRRAPRTARHSACVPCQAGMPVWVPKPHCSSIRSGHQRTTKLNPPPPAQPTTYPAS